jgi:UDP-N-acetylmuramoylalanine--D-glutamate ligase
MKKIGVLGLARSGVSAAKKAKELGYEVFISEYKSIEDCDINEGDLRGLDYECGGHSDKILDYPQVIVSPGIPHNVPVIKKLKENGNELISEIEFGFRIKHPATKVIAVTGSNGKSTTVSLIYHILNELNIKVALGGNIGIAFTSLPIEKYAYEYIILELSSFQLELVDTFRPEIAVLLNITPDHLNRYDSFDAYALAKFNIFKKQRKDDIAIIYDNDTQIMNFVNLIPASIKTFSLKADSQVNKQDSFLLTPRLKIDMNKTSLKGEHNILNIMATMLVLENLGIKLDNEEVQKAFSTFKGLSHRLEYVADINGVTFVNDSKATNTDSVKYALSAFKQRVRIIMGGSDKGEDFSILLEHLDIYAKKIYLIGETKDKMLKQFNSFPSVESCQDLKDAVEKAYHESTKGDIILLSPACASYDSFKNFEHRGTTFKEIVKSLANHE